VLVGGICGCLLAGVMLAAETITVATYNVENYGPAHRMTEAGFRKDYPKPEPEKRALRQVIRGLNADLLVLQEMGGHPYLEELRRDLRSEGVDYPHAALATAADADRHVAVLSRRPLRHVTTHADLEFAYFGSREAVKRGMVEARIATAAGELTVFAIHLKSRLTERADDPLSGIRRGGEATAIRDRILQLFPAPGTARFLILGDCNDTKSSRAAAALQRRGKTQISVLLPAEDSRGETWTHVYRREETYSRVDLIFASPAMQGAVRSGAARVFDGPGVREASDHRPVFVVIELEAAK
ncbi:MAG: endonuclease/exonuclease/phosphatase family protein, partial [Verrucomicrobia bacterium]|nr:endonuclease/exonuclease/phosphatase family protein [Verrucomicrobiota bacterium]